MLKFSAAICFISILGVGYCSRSIDRSTNKETVNAQLIEMEQQECTVYSALLTNLNVNDSKPILLAEETSINGLDKDNLTGDLKYIDQRSWGDDASEIIIKFISANEHSKTLKSCFNPQVETILVSKEEVEAIVEDPNGWIQFLIKHPRQSLWQFSQVAFNRGMTKALVFTTSESGGKAGHGSLVILVKENNAWVIRHRIVVWVS